MFQSPVNDPVLIFAIVMMLVLIAPIFAKKLKLPGIIGLLTAGIIFGPHVINLLERDKTIELLGTVGLLYIMFQAGLEIDLALVKKNKHYSLIFGLLTFSIPLILGTLAGYYFLNMRLATALLLASMFSSHTLLTFPIVSRLGFAKSRSVSSTIGGTIITDTLALIILAVIIGANQGELNYIFWIKLISFSSVYAVLVILILPIISRWFFSHFSNEAGIEDYVFVIAALFTCAYLSHIVGLEPIIGAFLAGLTLNSLIPEKSILMNRIQFVGDSLFIPFFLISVGMIVNPKLIATNLFTIRVMFTMVIVALSSKWLAAHLFGVIVKFSRNEKNLIYGLSVNQAAATLAAVLVGYRVGIFEESVLTGTILMIVVTCFAGAIITDKYSRKLVLETESRKDVHSIKNVERILVLINNPKTLNQLMDLAILLHSGNKEEPLYPLNITTESNDIEEKIILGENLLTKAMARGVSANKAVIPLSKIDVNLISAINKATKENRISKILLGWSEPVDFMNCYSHHAIQQFIYQSNELIFQAKIMHSLQLAKNINLILPPLINKHNGFLDTLYSVKQLFHSISAKVTIFTEEDTAEQIKDLMFKQKPNISGEFHYITSWKKIHSALQKVISPNDLIIMILSRPGRIAWRLIFERMPENIVKIFPNHNFIAVFPYFNPQDVYLEKEYFSQELTLLNTIPEQHFIFTEALETIPNVFNKMIQITHFRNQDTVLKQLHAILKESPIELSVDIMLLHIHTNEATDFQIYIAKSEQGFSLPEVNLTPKIVFILLSPLDQTPTEHLKILSEIARISQVKSFVKSILLSDSYKKFIESMKLMIENEESQF